MKNTLIFFMTVIGLVSCAKPVILKNNIPITSNFNNSCIQLDESLNNRQEVRSKYYNQAKVYYYYDLNEFLGELNQISCIDDKAVIHDIKILASAVTVRAAVTLNRFEFEVSVGLYNHKGSMEEKTYMSEVDSKNLFFLASKKKEYQQDSVALKKGFRDILDQIASDLKKAKI